MSNEIEFRNRLRNEKDLTHSKLEELAKAYGFTLQQARDEVTIINGYKGRRQW